MRSWPRASSARSARLPDGAGVIPVGAVEFHAFLDVMSHGRSAPIVGRRRTATFVPTMQSSIIKGIGGAEGCRPTLCPARSGQSVHDRDGWSRSSAAMTRLLGNGANHKGDNASDGSKTASGTAASGQGLAPPVMGPALIQGTELAHAPQAPAELPMFRATGPTSSTAASETLVASRGMSTFP